MKKHFYITLILFYMSCAYFNTMFNALEYYKSGSEKLENSRDNQITTDIRKDFNAAIDKSWKLINIHSDSNAYADDALLLIGKSHYQLREYQRSERFLQQFVNGYPNSNLLPEAQLWLARSLAKLERVDDALSFLNQIIEQDVNREHKSLALFTMGDLYRSQENYDEALKYYGQTVEMAPDEKLAAKALYAMGEIHESQQDYTSAIEDYNRLKDFTAPVQLEFKANMKKVNAYIQLNQLDEALRLLKIMSGESRFMDMAAQIDAKIGDVFVLQNEPELAEEQYENTLSLYPKTEGSAQAAFGLGLLMETYRQNPDSAIKLYEKVKKEFRMSEFGTDAVNRANTLKSYLKIKNDIRDDLAELAALAEADSGAQEVEMDSLQTGDPAPTSRNKRSRDDILGTLEKHRFALAEFFLLNMQDMDSAQTAYTDFIRVSEDSNLISKAYYALYYLNQHEIQNYQAADSFKTLLINEYPDSEFAAYFMSLKEKNAEVKKTTDLFKEKYLQAESLRLDKKFDQAIRLFNEIAVQDSGSEWAEKSRYSVAWIYEKDLKDFDKAVEAYRIIASEYPKTAFGKIAQNKIKPPPEPKPESEESAVQPDSSIQQIDQENKTQEPGKEQEKIRKEPDLKSNADSLKATRRLEEDN